MNKLFSISAMLFCASIFSATAYSQETGIAEVYPSSEEGKVTASGANYNPQKYTAAHKIHAMGTQLKVTRTDEGAKRWVIVTINDRGPYTGGHIIQLSKAAGRRIGIDENSTASVVVEVVAKSAVAQPNPPTIKPDSPPAPTAGTENNQGQTKPVQTEATKAPASTEPAKTNSPAQKANSAQVDQQTFPLVRDDYKTFGLYKIALHHAASQGYGVQVVSLNKPDNLLQQIAGLQNKWFDNILVSVEPGADSKTPLYKMILGPFNTEDQARSYANSLKKKYKMSGFVVNLNSIQYGPTSP